MQDLTPDSDNELSLKVFNDKYFYLERMNRRFLKALLDEEFIYTAKQEEVLVKNLSKEIK